MEYACLENHMDRGTWWATVRRVAESDMTEVTQQAHARVYMSMLLSQFVPPSPSSHLQVHFLLLRLYSCPENRFIFTIICINIQYLFFSFWLTSLCMAGFRSIHITTNDPISFLLFGWVIMHCIYVPHLLDPFICWWIFRLLPYPDCCK